MRVVRRGSRPASGPRCPARRPGCARSSSRCSPRRRSTARRPRSPGCPAPARRRPGGTACWSRPSRGCARAPTAAGRASQPSVARCWAARARLIAWNTAWRQALGAARLPGADALPGRRRRRAGRGRGRLAGGRGGDRVDRPAGRGAAAASDRRAAAGAGAGSTAPARPVGCRASPELAMAITPMAVSIAHAAVRPRAGARRVDTEGIVPRNPVTGRLHLHRTTIMSSWLFRLSRVTRRPAASWTRVPHVEAERVVFPACGSSYSSTSACSAAGPQRTRKPFVHRHGGFFSEPGIVRPSSASAISERGPPA